MALLFMDSFDHYATADINKKWTSTYGSGVSIGAYGRNGTNGMRLNSGTVWVQKTVSGGVSTLILSFAGQITATAPTTSIIAFGSNLYWECGLMLQADMTLRPYRANNASFDPGQGTGNVTLIGSSTSVALQSGVWAYIEVKMTCDNAAGVCVVRINGVEVLNATGLDTQYSSASLTRACLSLGTAGPFNIDDLAVLDNTGSLNNDFMGDVTISAVFPNGAGNSSQWTPSAGSNYDCANETSPNDDTDYNATSTVGNKDLYAFASAPAGADIRAVQVLAAVRKSAEGPGQVVLVTRSGGTDYDGATQGIGGTAYSYVREVLETDPGSGSPLAAWTESGFNAAEFGIKKTG